MPIEPPEHNIYANPPTPPGDPPNEHNVASAIRYEAQIVQSYLSSFYLVLYIALDY